MDFFISGSGNLLSLKTIPIFNFHGISVYSYITIQKGDSHTMFLKVKDFLRNTKTKQNCLFNAVGASEKEFIEGVRSLKEGIQKHLSS